MQESNKDFVVQVKVGEDIEKYFISGAATVCDLRNMIVEDQGIKYEGKNLQIDGRIIDGSVALNEHSGITRSSALKPLTMVENNTRGKKKPTGYKLFLDSFHRGGVEVGSVSGTTRRTANYLLETLTTPDKNKLTRFRTKGARERNWGEWQTFNADGDRPIAFPDDYGLVHVLFAKPEKKA